jgi:signal transduction histidine kinase
VASRRLHGDRPNRDGWQRWRSSLRLRYAVIATSLAALTFALGGGVALAIYRNSLISTVEQGLSAGAHQLARSVRHGPVPDPIPMPVGPGVPRIEILNSAGHIVSGDPASVTSPPLDYLSHFRPGHVFQVHDPAYLPERTAAVIVLRSRGRTGPLTIIASGSLDQAEGKADHALLLSAELAGISSVAVALAAWLATGRALRRVEKIRSQVAGITGSDDLTRRVQEGTDELGRLGKTLNQMLAAMAKSNDRQRRFVADAAHEVRTPLAGITATVDVALHHPETVDRAWVSELAVGHRRLTRLVNDLLELAALDGSAPRRWQNIDLAGVVADAVRRPTPAGIDLRAGAVDTALVDGDQAQLVRIVTNLVDNALRFARTAVEVSVVSQKDEAVLVVADDGPGVPPQDRTFIWERFARSDAGRSRSGGGTGLGLALVKEIAEAHGGSVSVARAQRLGGAEFVVRLPLSSAAPPGRQSAALGGQVSLPAESDEPRTGIVS